MQVLLKDNYFTGIYTVNGKLEGGIEVNELPPEKDSNKMLAYKLVKNKWVFDENKYQEILNAEAEEEKQAKIKELQSELNESDYKIIKCNEYKLAGLELPYNIEELHKQRQAIRDKINQLQGE